MHYHVSVMKSYCIFTKTYHIVALDYSNDYNLGTYETDCIIKILKHSYAP